MMLEFDVQYQLAADLKFLQNNKGEKEVIKVIQTMLAKAADEKSITEMVLSLSERIHSGKEYPPEAAYLLAKCHQYGIGIPNDKNSIHIACSLYQEAYKRGFALAEFQLYQIKAQIGFNDESKMKDMNPKYVFEIFKRAANLGYAPAQSRLGMCYQMGMGVETSPKQAAELYQQAVDNGYAPAQTCLGYCYEWGFGVAEKNLKRAIELYKRPASFGNIFALNALEKCLQQFIKQPVEQDAFDESMAICKFALSNGIKEASLKLGKLCEMDSRADYVASLGYYQYFLRSHQSPEDTKASAESQTMGEEIKEAHERESMLSPVVIFNTKEYMRQFFIEYYRQYQTSVPDPLLVVVSEYAAGTLNISCGAKIG